MSELFNYNTQSQKLIISEYGRSMQNMVFHVLTIKDKIQRTKMAEALIGVMEILNPQVKEQNDYLQKLWDHLHIISDFQLDVECPFPIPIRKELAKKPEKIPYSTQPIRFRFYGRNLQNMVNKAAIMDESEIKSEFLNLLASFMSNSSRNWNNENLSNNQLADHLELMSGKKIAVDPESLEITLEQRRKKFFTPNNNSNNNVGSNNKKYFNKNKKHNNFKK